MGALVWQSAHDITEIRSEFFSFDFLKDQPVLQTWPTHSLVLHLNAFGELASDRIAVEDLDISEGMLTQLMNLSTLFDDGAGQWVEAEESEFRDRAGDRDALFPDRFIEMLETAFGVYLVAEGYVRPVEKMPDRVHAGFQASDSVSGYERQKRGPITKEKNIPEHWVTGSRKPGGEECTSICELEYSDPRHGACLNCGRKTWKRRASIHTPRTHGLADHA